MVNDFWDGEEPQEVGHYKAADADAEEFFKAGVFLLKRNKPKDALVAFWRAFSIRETDPRYMSYLGLCIAIAENRLADGCLLCEKAVKKDYYRAELFLNLGKVYVMMNNRRKAHQALRKGLSLDQDNRAIRQELEKMGVRKPAVLPFLERNHPLNKVAGKVLHKLRLR